MNNIAGSSACNARELEARGEERLAEANELEALVAAKKAEAHRLFAAARRCADATQQTVAPQHMTRAEYANRSGVSGATVTRWLAEGMPSIPVGTTVRIDPTEADAWRRERGRKPTLATTKPSDVDVAADLSRAGLRVVGGSR